MAQTVADRELSEALHQVAAGLDGVFDAGLEPVDAKDAIVLVERLEQLARRLGAAQVEVIDSIDRAGLHRADGHHSAKTMVRHVAGISGGEAAGRAKTAKALRDLPETRAAYRSGDVGSCQVRRMARAHANQRVRDRLGDSESRLLERAKTESYKFFDQIMTDWVRLADEDGTCDTNQRNHENRDAKLVQDFDQSWVFTAGCASLAGAEIHTIFQHFIDAEWQTDWEKARIEHGDDATAEHIERTDAQRRFDAFYGIFQRAASTPPGGKAPELVYNIVVDQRTYERQLVALASGRRSAADPDDESYRCSTLDGRPVEPTEAVAASLLAKVRRVVLGADSVVIDLGRTQRLFTGSSRLAAQLAATECFWPGCHVPATQCQIDHLVPFGERDDGGGRGRTDPGNGGPACGKHNRFKEQGFSVWRDADGRWHVHRPDGTEIR